MNAEQQRSREKEVADSYFMVYSGMSRRPEVKHDNPQAQYQFPVWDLNQVNTYDSANPPLQLLHEHYF